MATKAGTLKGPQGLKGDPGDTGAAGGKGPTGDPGAKGSTGAPGPVQVSTQAGNTARLGTDAKLYVPASSVGLADNTQDGLLRKVSGLATDFVDGTNHTQDWGLLTTPVITDQRLRNYNALNNPNFEVDSRLCGTVKGFTSVSGVSIDRWILGMGGAFSINVQQNPGVSYIPGTSYQISRNYVMLNLNAQNTTLAAGDFLQFDQYIEGIRWRELANGPMSLSFLFYSAVAPLKFSVAMRDMNGSNTVSWVQLCTHTAAGNWQYFTFPNIPVPPSGSFSVLPGQFSVQLSFTLACGSTYLVAPSNAWQAGNFIGASGMDNWGTSAVNSKIALAFVQLEPNTVCTPFLDIDWLSNLRSCQRYYAKGLPSAAMKFPNGNWRSLGQYIAGTTCRAEIRFPVEMYATPTVTLCDEGANVNSVYIDSTSGGTQRWAVSSVNATTRGAYQINTTSTPTTPAYSAPSVLGQWQADTGI